MKLRIDVTFRNVPAKDYILTGIIPSISIKDIHVNLKAVCSTNYVRKEKNSLYRSTRTTITSFRRHTLNAYGESLFADTYTKSFNVGVILA